jgi:hypothetical protein
MMLTPSSETDFFHICTTPLGIGSLIDPGGRGRILNAIGWKHASALAEMAIELSRLSKYPHLPSRLSAAFVFLTREEADTFVSRNTAAFGLHFLYRVRLVDPTAANHVTDWRLNMPLGLFRADWADAYWLDIATQATAIPGVNGAAEGIGQLREMLTLSQLRIEERLN